MVTKRAIGINIVQIPEKNNTSDQYEHSGHEEETSSENDRIDR
ncbi:hypothetical protein [Chryseobacterium sp.]|nr:hypothetical protein [Chryseobacterium sp.]